MEIDEETVRQMAINGATDEEISLIHQVDESHLCKKFGKLLVEARAQRRVMIRQLQNAAAKKGNAGILSLLGKHELGQARTSPAGEPDEPEPELEPKVG
jgi:hypothetical protein